MKEGYALDTLIAERVMGWVLQEKPYTLWLTPDAGDRIYTPAYSTDIAAAWLVVAEMERRRWWCQMRTPFEGVNSDGYWAGFTPHSTTGWNGKPDHWTQAETLPLAICRAALEAISK